VRSKRWAPARARQAARARSGTRALVLAALAMLALTLPNAAAAQTAAPLGHLVEGRPTVDAPEVEARQRSTKRSDLDGDGIPNRRDRDLDGDRTPNRVDPDIDGDGLRNDLDHDIDGDRVGNAFDADSDSSGGVGPTPARAAPLEPGFLGLVSDDAFWGTDADPGRSRTIGAAAAAGARILRHSFSWSIIEPQPGRYDFALHDDFVAAAAQKDLSVLPILFDPPAYRSSRPASGARRGFYPPASNAEFAAFAATLVRRYGPHGGFWRAHPELPPLPIRSWQVWNEPNLPQYWPAGPNPAAYAAMLKQVHPAIKAVDPGARVISAGINESEQGIKLVPFLRAMYGAGARGSFDVLGLHPYAPGSDLVVDQVTRAVRELRRHGDEARVLVTELGWASGGPARRAMVVREQGQAALVRRTLTELWRLRGRLRLDGIFYYDWRDVPPNNGERDRWGLHTGLLRRDGSAKPALRALTRLAGAATGAQLSS
jgi:hypothetical protein